MVSLPASPSVLLARERSLVDGLVAGRRRIDESLDWMRFRLDTFPRSGPLRRASSVGYQPLPWVDSPGRRTEGSESRWEAIAGLLDSLAIRSALDVGCNLGYFTIMLAERGIPTIGVERRPTAYRTALYGIRKAAARNAGILTLSVEPD